MTTQTYDAPATTTNPDLAALILRLANGGLFLAHAWLKIVIFTPAGTAAFFQGLGLPGPMAYLIIAAELFGGLALIAGFKTRLVSLALIPILLGAIATVHFAPGFFFMNEGGGWEFPAFWAVTLLVLSLLGDGAYALGRR
jgi:putative oxidoreductase